MWASFSRIIFLSFVAQKVSSSSIASRQEQCQSAANDSALAACKMQAAFGGSSIIPQLLPNFSPTAALSVKYNNVVIGGAQQMSPSKVCTQPFLSLSFISNNTQVLQQAYVILGLEFQSQSKSIRPFWIQSAVKIDAGSGDMTSSIPPIVPYMSPDPSQGSGTNEYIFLVFQDPGLDALVKQNAQLASALSKSFQFQNFMQVTGLASPIAGSYFKSTFDGQPINCQHSSASSIQQVQNGTEATQTKGSSGPANASQTVTSTQSQNSPATNNSASVIMRPTAGEPSAASSQIATASANTNSSSEDGGNQQSSQAGIVDTQMYLTASVALAAFGLLCA